MAQKNATLRALIEGVIYDLMPKGSVYNVWVDDTTTLAEKLAEVITSLNGKVTPEQLTTAIEEALAGFEGGGDCNIKPFPVNDYGYINAAELENDTFYFYNGTKPRVKILVDYNNIKSRSEECNKGVIYYHSSSKDASSVSSSFYGSLSGGNERISYTVESAIAHAMSKMYYTEYLPQGAHDNNFQYTPARDYNPATKKYVDDTVSEAVGNIEITDFPHGNWNQNDPTADDYIKNRTHWVEKGGLVTVLPTTELILNEDMGAFVIPNALELTSGNEYVVKFDGVEFTTLCQDAPENEDGVKWMLGDIGMMDGTPVTGEPFVILVLSPEVASEIGMGALIMFVGTASTISIDGYEEIVHTIDPKFLPDNVDSLLSMTEEVEFCHRTINLNPGGYEYGTFTGSTGVENNNMSPITVSFRSADYIPVNGGRSIAIYYDAYEWNKNDKGIAVKVVEYDADKNILVSNSSVNPYVVTGNPTLTLSANTAFIRIALDKWAEVTTPLNEILIAIYYAEEAVKEYIPYTIGETRRMVRNDNIHDPLHNKKIVYDGDSICSSEGYAKIIAEMTGCMCTNKAVGGSRLASASGKRSVVDNLANLPSDGDLYCFQAGINDFWAGTAVGTCDRSNYTNTVDPTTICGAMETIFRYCLANFVGKPVCFIITHKVNNTSYSEINDITFWDYRDAMIQVCQKYSIPYYDAFAESGLNGWDSNQSNAYLTGASGTADGTHPNEEGYKRYYVPQLLALFRKIMPV